MASNIQCRNSSSRSAAPPEGSEPARRGPAACPPSAERSRVPAPQAGPEPSPAGPRAPRHPRPGGAIAAGTRRPPRAPTTRRESRMTTTARDDRRVPIRGRVEHLTVAERAARGRAARRACPVRPTPSSSPARTARTRSPCSSARRRRRVPELVPIRYGRMLVSPFTFYRGAALIMASDLAATPTTGLRVQLCGDAHLSNFGVFGSPERRLVFDINDFDETLPGTVRVGRQAARGQPRGGRPRPGLRRRGPGGDRPHLRSHLPDARWRSSPGNPTSTSSTRSIDVEEMVARFRATVSAKLREARREEPRQGAHQGQHAGPRAADPRGGRRPRITADPPLIVPMRDLLPDERAGEFLEWAHARLREYRRTLEIDRRRLLERYEFVDLARKVVGVGSVGTRAWIALMLGRDRRDPLFLQLKEAQPSVLEEFVGRSATATPATGWSPAAADAGGRATSSSAGCASPTASTAETRDFYVRQLRDWKGSADDRGDGPRGHGASTPSSARWTLARAHARSGDPVAIAAFLGTETSSTGPSPLLRRLRRPQRARLPGSSRRPSPSGGSRRRPGCSRARARQGRHPWARVEARGSA